MTSRHGSHTSKSRYRRQVLNERHSRRAAAWRSALAPHDVRQREWCVCPSLRAPRTRNRAILHSMTSRPTPKVQTFPDFSIMRFLRPQCAPTRARATLPSTPKNLLTQFHKPQRFRRHLSTSFPRFSRFVIFKGLCATTS